MNCKKESDMGYWTEVKDLLLKGADLAIEGIKEGTETVVEKSKEGMAFARLKKNLYTAQRKLRNLLADLGDITHDLYREKKDIYADPEVKRIMGEVLKLEEECKKIEKELEELRFKKQK